MSPDQGGGESRLEEELEALTAELVELQDQLLALYALSRVLRGQLEVRPLLETLVHEAVRLVKARGGFALLRRPGQPEVLVTSQGLGLEPQILWGDFERLRGESEVVLAHRGGTVMLIPIQVRGELAAALGLLARPGIGFGAPERKLASAIATQAGAQIESVLLHQEALRRARLELESELARRVQAELTPAVPTGLSGLEVFAESRSALAVGGDFYDFEVGLGGLFCVLGDVAGKGIPAALLVAMTRALVRSALRARPGSAPAAILAAANASLYHDYSKLGLFSTVVAARVEPERRRLWVANAGHAPVIYRPAGARARLLPADGLPVGVLEVWEGGSVELPLGPGDLFVAATDGFTEANPAGKSEHFGHDRLLGLVNTYSALGAAELGRALFEASDRFSGGAEPADDRTLLVLRGT